MAPQGVIIKVQLVFDVLVDGMRYADGAGFAESLEPGGNIDAIAEDVVAIDDDVAEIDADTQLETALERDGVVEGTGCSLHRDGAVQRVDDARKIRQQAVA